MADYNSSLPIRSEADGTDERVQTKIVDSANPDTQQATVDTDSNLKVAAYGDNPAGADVALLLSEEGSPNGNGNYDVTNNSNPASSALVGHDRGASIDETSQNQRVTAVAGESDNINLDVAIHQSDGTNITEANPLFVAMAENPAAEIVDYDVASAVAKDSSANHDYTVGAGLTLLLQNIWASGSGKMKIEVQYEDGAAAGTYSTKWVGFNSTANPNIEIPIAKIGKQVAGAIVRIIKTNLDNQPQDLYSTIVGIEK